jgi:hypothetical protein
MGLTLVSQSPLVQGVQREPQRLDAISLRGGHVNPRSFVASKNFLDNEWVSGSRTHSIFPVLGQRSKSSEYVLRQVKRELNQIKKLLA